MDQSKPNQGPKRFGSPLFRRLSGELAASSRRDFERLILPHLFVRWRDCILPTPLGEFDRKGVDILVWGDRAPHPLVVQAKGFEVTEQEVGHEQLRQCLESLDAFEGSNITCGQYVLVHNRDHRNQAVWVKVRARLANLVASGQVRKAALIDRRGLLEDAFRSMSRHLKNRLASVSSSSLESWRSYEPELCEPIDVVPFDEHEYSIGRNQLLEQSPTMQKCEDPARRILATSGSGFFVLLGSAGLGKTTICKRLHHLSSKVVYVHAGVITPTHANSKTLIAALLQTGELIPDGVPEQWQPALRAIAIDRSEWLLKDPEAGLVLIVDAVDENHVLARRGAMLQFFNALQLIEVPVITVMRTEFWLARVEDLRHAVGRVAKSRGGRQAPRSIHALELRGWRDEDILAAVNRYQAQVSDHAAKSRVQRLRDAIADGEFARFYGDIPRTPLYLRFILETVAQGGVHCVGRPDLLKEVVEQKVLRDWSAPLQDGHGGRLFLGSGIEGSADVLEVSLRAMKLAATQMSTVDEDGIVLLPKCTFDEIRQRVSDLQIRDWLSLALHSLLVPVQRTRSDARQELRFAHRVFHEFFFAWSLFDEGAAPESIQADESIRQWLSEMRHSWGREGS